MPYALVLLRNFPVIQEFVFQYADLTETQHMASTAHNERQVFNLSLRFDLQLMLSHPLLAILFPHYYKPEGNTGKGIKYIGQEVNSRVQHRK